MKKNKIMNLNEMMDFINHIGRSELYDELKFINEKHLNCCYLKAIRVALIELGYVEKWVNEPFRDLLEHRYFHDGENLKDYEIEDLYFFYNKNEVDDFIKNKKYNIKKRTKEEIREMFKDYGAQDLDKIRKEEKELNKISSLTLEEVNDYKNKKVIQYSLAGIPINVFNSITEANKELKKPLCASNINACCKGRTKTAFGYIWKYYDDAQNAKWKNIKLIIKEPLSPNSRVAQNIKEAYGFDGILEMLNYYIDVLSNKCERDYNIFLPFDINFCSKENNIIIADSGKITKEAENFLKSKLAYKLLATESSKITIKIDEFEHELNIIKEDDINE